MSNDWEHKYLDHLVKFRNSNFHNSFATNMLFVKLIGHCHVAEPVNKLILKKLILIYVENITEFHLGKLV